MQPNVTLNSGELERTRAICMVMVWVLFLFPNLPWTRVAEGRCAWKIEGAGVTLIATVTYIKIPPITITSPD